ncbi:MAG TPA: outer membrane protein assembly factor BamD [Blastocatellia bacterium]|nr:outer membrane protein assembly factor BamD [Blastocatellia bacterium]
MNRAQRIGQNKKRLGKRFSRGGRAWFLAALIVCAIAAAALGCSWPGTDHSVRFNAFRSAKEFGRLPRLSHSGDADNKLFSWSAEYDKGENYEEGERETKGIDVLWDESLRAEQSEDLATVRRKLQEYLQRTARLRETGYSEPKDFRHRRNAAFDKLDALAALDQGASEDSVRCYLRARTLVDDGQPVVKLHAEAAEDVHLADNVAYLWAVIDYSADAEAGIAKFKAFAARYPHSEKREAALYMAALATLKIAPRAKVMDSFAPCDGDCPKLMRDAQAGFRRVIHDYPHGRLTADAQGWIAYIYRQLGDRAAALAEYYRMLAARDEASRIEAVFSLGIARYQASETDMARVEKLIEGEPAAALAYAYHNVYNIALEPLSGYGIGAGSSAGEQEQRYKNNADELKRIVAFASRMMKRYGSGAVGSGFVLRLAQASLELDDDAEAARLAHQALSGGAQANIRAEALWVEAVALYHLKRLKEARSALTQLVAENPNNRYTEGARRNLAMVAEDMNDLDGALEQYLALDYRLDVAYFVDVLMPTDQLAAFIKNHPTQPHSDELQYALGVRYLRDRRWNDARQTLMVIHSIGRGADNGYSHYYPGSYSEPSSDPVKSLNWDERIRGVRPEWIEQDLHTANDLERLEQQVNLAQGDEAKAEALYQLASYQYQGDLLFYNPAWNGMRQYHLYDLDSGGGFRRADESRLLFDYMQKHDAASSALPIYLDVVNRYPNTRAARDALYTAAVCHDRLASYNNYWRSIYDRGGFAGSRMVNYQDVKRAYPGYRYPLGTRGWEPATRTVNGGPGWALPPKPKPRPSRARRALLLFNKVMQVAFKPLGDAVSAIVKTITAIFQAIWKAVLWVCHWLWLGYLCFWLRFMWRRSREARRLMREGLGRCRERPAVEKGDTSLVDSITPQAAAFNQYLGHDWRDHFLKLTYDLLYKLRQMAMEKNARHVLLLYAATHWMLAVIAIKLLADW